MNSRIFRVIHGSTRDSVFLSLGAMSHERSYAKQAQQLGILLALADDNLQLRAVALQTIRETTSRLKKENPIFNRRLFTQDIARTAFPADLQKESETLSLLLYGTQAPNEQVA